MDAQLLYYRRFLSTCLNCFSTTRQEASSRFLALWVQGVCLCGGWEYRWAAGLDWGWGGAGVGGGQGEGDPLITTMRTRTCSKSRSEAQLQPRTLSKPTSNSHIQIRGTFTDSTFYLCIGETQWERERERLCKSKLHSSSLHGTTETQPTYR